MFDVSRPASPEELHASDRFDETEAGPVVIEGGYAYHLRENRRIDVVDLTNDANSIPPISLEVNDYSQSLLYADGALLVSAEYGFEAVTLCR